MKTIQEKAVFPITHRPRETSPPKGDQPRANCPPVEFSEELALLEMSFDLCDSRDGVRRFFTHEGNDALTVHTTANFVLNLAKKAKFRAGENRYTGNASIEMTDAGKLFIKMIGASFEQTFWTFPSHRFDPRFMLVVDAVREHGLARQALLPAPSNDHVVRIAESLNACVTRIHDTANSAAFKAKVRDFQRSAKKNQAGLERYIPLLFRNHGSLQVLRIDLGYRREAADEGADKADLTLKEVKGDWKRFYDSIEQRLPVGARLGFVRKIEFARQASYRIRLFLFCDASIVTDDFRTATLLGEIWQSEDVTRGRGLYYVLNRKKPSAEPTGFGLILADDEMSRRRLEFGARALTAPDLYVRYAGPDRRNLFIKGNMPGPMGEKGK